MTKSEVLKLEEAVLAALHPPLRTKHEEWARRAARYAAMCTVSKAVFSQTRPPVPIVTLKNGKCQPTIRVVQGSATAFVVRAMECGSVVLESDTKALTEAVLKTIPRVEQGVEAAAKRLLDNPAAVQKKKDQLQREEDVAKAAKRSRMVKELKTMIKEGFSEDDVVQMYREALVGDVLAS